MQEIKNIHEQNFVNIFRAKINESVSSLIDAFSGWLIGGFGAASALLISQYDSVSKHLSPYLIREFLYLLMAALVAAIIQKYLSSIILANAKGALAASELGEAASKKSIELNFEIIFEEISRSILPFSRWAVRRSFKKATDGDLVSSSRKFAQLCQIQGLLTLVQAIFTLLAIYKLAEGFHV